MLKKFTHECTDSFSVLKWPKSVGLCLGLTRSNSQACPVTTAVGTNYPIFPDSCLGTPSPYLGQQEPGTNGPSRESETANALAVRPWRQLLPAAKAWPDLGQVWGRDERPPQGDVEGKGQRRLADPGQTTASLPLGVVLNKPVF